MTPSIKRHLFLASVVPMILAAHAGAATVIVPNFSFEANATNDNAETLGNTGTGLGVTDWIAGGGPAQAFGTADPNNTKFAGSTGNDTPLPAPADGGQALFINTGSIANAVVTVTTATSVATIASETAYTLTVAVGNPLGAGTLLPGLFKLSLRANGVEVSTSAFEDGALITDGAFQDFTASFTTTAASPLDGQALTIQLSADNDGPNANSQIFFDNVRLDASAVPEPGSATLLAAFGILAGFRRSRSAL